MDGAYGRGDNDFDLNTFSWSNLSEEELEAYVNGIAAGARGEDVGEGHDDELSVDALYRKGKSKGKGKGGAAPAWQRQQKAGWQKGGQKGDRNPLTAPPLPGQKDLRICHWCGKAGHIMADCEAKKAGKPLAPPMCP